MGGKQRLLVQDLNNVLYLKALGPGVTADHVPGHRAPAQRDEDSFPCFYAGPEMVWNAVGEQFGEGYAQCDFYKKAFTFTFHP